MRDCKDDTEKMSAAALPPEANLSRAENAKVVRRKQQTACASGIFVSENPEALRSG